MRKSNLSSEIVSLERKLEKLQNEIFSKLSRWQRVQLARHPKRPYTLDYINHIFTDFVELHGDRGFADDKAVICGFAKIDGQKAHVVGQQKGRDTKAKLMRNFGMMHPGGLSQGAAPDEDSREISACRFSSSLIPLVPIPGIQAEERGQAEAIARNIKEMSVLPVPIIITIIGEGASGGALGIGIGDITLDAGKRLVFGDFARRMCSDSVARQCQSARMQPRR